MLSGIKIICIIAVFTVFAGCGEDAGEENAVLDQKIAELEMEWYALSSGIAINEGAALMAALSVECPGDQNNDGKVDHWDVKIVCNYFDRDMPTGSYYNPDVNDDGVINVLDLAVVGRYYGEICWRPDFKPPEQIEGAQFGITSKEFGMKDYGCPFITITVKNTGDKIGYNVACRVYAKDKNGVIVDDGFAYFASGGDIQPGEMARAEAIFFDLESLNDVTLCTVRRPLIHNCESRC